MGQGPFYATYLALSALRLNTTNDANTGPPHKGKIVAMIEATLVDATRETIGGSAKTIAAQTIPTTMVVER